MQIQAASLPTCCGCGMACAQWGLVTPGSFIDFGISVFGSRKVHANRNPHVLFFGRVFFATVQGFFQTVATLRESLCVFFATVSTEKGFFATVQRGFFATVSRDEGFLRRFNGFFCDSSTFFYSSTFFPHIFVWGSCF